MFSFSADEAGSTFECSLDNSAFAACTPPQQYAGLSDGPHTLTVRAVDRVGNTDATPATRGWTIDTTAPQTTIGSGQTTGTSATFTFTSNEPAATFECSLDNAAFAGCTSPRQLTGLAPGGRSFRVRARDGAGNVDASPAAHSWTISAPQGCAPTLTLTATADAWIDQNSPAANKGTDSILKVQSKGPADNFRALVRFTLPTNLPPGCTLSSATLRAYATSSKPGRTLQALRLASAWTENLVSWSNQPPTAGAAAAAASANGDREWNVTDQVREMITPAVTKTRAEAEQAAAALAAGRSWDTVVAEYSIDRSTGSQDGKLPAVSKGDHPKALDDAIFDAAKGRITGPVKTPTGYYVFEVTKVQPAAQQTLEQAKPTIEQLLAAEGQQAALDGYIEEFRRKWRAKTECGEGYETADCKNGPPERTAARPTS
jgi:PPIC-type PPIASE domain